MPKPAEVMGFSRKIVNKFAMSPKLCNFTRFYEKG